MIKLDADAPRGLLVRSHAGDDDIKCKDYVCERLGLPAFKPNGKGRRPSNAAAQARVKKALAAHDAKAAKQKTVVAVYEYWDATGELLYVKKRFEPKDFRQYAADGTPGLKGTPQVLYRLPELIEAAGAPCFIVEGEKDCDRLRNDLGVCAVTADIGTWKPDLVEPLRDRDVLIVPDHDATGQARAREAAMAVHSVAASVRVVHLPGLEHKEDVSNWLDRNDTNADAFTEMCMSAPLWVPGIEATTTNHDDGESGVRLVDFYAYLPAHNYIFVPTREPWPGSSVDMAVPPVDIGKEKPMRASAWLDINRAVVQMTWGPSEPLEIRDRIINDGGWVERKGVSYSQPVSRADS